MAEDLDQVLQGVEEHVIQGMTRRIYRYVGDVWLPANTEPGYLAELLKKCREPAVDLAKLIAAFEDIQTPYPMADLWLHTMEAKYERPYELVTSTVKRGSVGLVFDASNGPTLRRFADETIREHWFLASGHGKLEPVDWDALDDVVDDDFSLDAWSDVLDRGVFVDPSTGFWSTLFETEQGDVFLIPDGMIPTDNEDGTEVEKPDEYYSWPVDAIKANDDPYKFGFDLADVVINQSWSNETPLYVKRLFARMRERLKFRLWIERPIQGVKDLKWEGYTSPYSSP